MAFLAAAEACGRGRPISLERRTHPRWPIHQHSY